MRGIMVAKASAFTPNPELPVINHRELLTKRGMVSGSFITLVEPSIIFIAQSASVKPGTCYAVDWKATTKLKAEHDPSRWIYKPYKNLYRLRRAFLSYIQGWTLANIEIVSDLHELSDKSLIASYGMPLRDPARYRELQQSLQGILTSDEDDAFTKNQKVLHGMTVFRTAEEQKGSRRYPGFASARNNFGARLAELNDIKSGAVQIGTVIAHYIERIMTIVVEERAGLEQLLALDTKQLLTVNRAERIRERIPRMWRIFRGRPFTHVAKYIEKELASAAELIEQGFASQKEGFRNECCNGAKSLLRKSYDSLVLLERQYEIESVLTDVAEALRMNCDFEEEDAGDLMARIYAVHEKIPLTLGQGFENDLVPEIRSLVGEAWLHAQQRNLKKVKDTLREASDKI